VDNVSPKRKVSHETVYNFVSHETVNTCCYLISFIML